jgi:hypothetical protein
MAEKGNPVLLDDIFTASANGVLRAIEARQAGAERLTVSDLVRSGFGVHIHIIAGGIFGGPIERLQTVAGAGSPVSGGPAGR